MYIIKLLLQLLLLYNILDCILLVPSLLHFGAHFTNITVLLTKPDDGPRTETGSIVCLLQ